NCAMDRQGVRRWRKHQLRATLEPAAIQIAQEAIQLQRARQQAVPWGALGTEQFGKAPDIEVADAAFQPEAVQFLDARAAIEGATERQKTETAQVDLLRISAEFRFRSQVLQPQRSLAEREAGTVEAARQQVMSKILK